MNRPKLNHCCILLKGSDYKAISREGGRMIGCTNIPGARRVMFDTQPDGTVSVDIFGLYILSPDALNDIVQERISENRMCNEAEGTDVRRAVRLAVFKTLAVTVVFFTVLVMILTRGQV